MRKTLTSSLPFAKYEKSLIQPYPRKSLLQPDLEYRPHRHRPCLHRPLASAWIGSSRQAFVGTQGSRGRAG